jgi:hypothetical protein
MTIILYWGDDDFAIAKAVTAIQQSSLDPAWMSFNYEKIAPERDDAVITALNQAMTPPLWCGKKTGVVGRYYPHAAMRGDITRRVGADITQRSGDDNAPAHQ